MRLSICTLLVATLLGCGSEDAFEARRYQEPVAAAPGSVTIIEPGVERAAPCSGCHTLHAQLPFARRSDELDTFHTTLGTVAHGDLPCLSCHDSENRNFLSLAGGERLPLRAPMRLCAQCHGPQFRDYSRGSHGGMTGFWDLQSGDRERNACTVCHAPHTPAYPGVLPAFPPGDRFLTPRENPHD